MAINGGAISAIFTIPCPVGASYRGIWMIILYLKVADQCGTTECRNKHPTKFMINSDTYFFDIDGTLLVTRDLVHWNGLHQAMLEVYGVDTTIEGIPYHGKTDVGILRMALDRCGISGIRFEQGLAAARAVISREVSEHASEICADACPS